MPLQTNIDNIKSIQRAQECIVFTDVLEKYPDYKEAYRCSTVLLKINSNDIFSISAIQTEVNYLAEIDHLFLKKEKEIPKIESFNPKGRTDYIEYKKIFCNSNLEFITFLENGFYTKINSNFNECTFEACTSLFIIGEEEKLLICYLDNPNELLITSNNEDINSIVKKKELKGYKIQLLY